MASNRCFFKAFMDESMPKNGYENCNKEYLPRL